MSDLNLFLLALGGTIAVYVLMCKVVDRIRGIRYHRDHSRFDWFVDPRCRYCAVHDWARWHAGTCVCGRCQRIRDMEAALLDGGSDE